MVTELLVAHSIEDGRRLLQALDENNFPFNAALWSYSSDRGAWRLLVATEVFDKHGPLEAYRRILQILESAGILLALQDISVVSERNSLIKLLKSVVTTDPDSIEGIPLTARLIDRVYVDDAYIYRMA